MAHIAPPDTPFMGAILKVVGHVDRAVTPEFSGIIDMYVVGGVAVHIYTQDRVSTDIDAVYSHQLVLPAYVVEYDDGHEKAAVSLDTQYFDGFAVMHPDWRRDSNTVGTYGRIRLRVISPHDLVVSKIARMGDNDRNDIRSLAEAGLVDSAQVEDRFREAIGYYVAGTYSLEPNLKDALRIIDEAAPSARVHVP